MMMQVGGRWKEDISRWEGNGWLVGRSRNAFCFSLIHFVVSDQAQVQTEDYGVR